MSTLSLIRRLSALFLGMALLVAGNGLFGTLLSLRAAAEGFSPSVIGGLTTSFFAGYLAASLVAPPLIARAGLARSFAVAASLVSTVALLTALWVSESAWLLLRGLHGACFASAIIIAEGWLNAEAGTRLRGQVMGAYSAVYLGAWTLSQALVTAASPSGFQLFSLVSILFSVALIPLLLTPHDSSPDVSVERVPLSRLVRLSPVGVLGCLFGGAIINALLGLTPLYAHHIGLGSGEVATLMAALVGGALFTQWPLGWLSDRQDRRLILAATAALAMVLTLVLAAMPSTRPATIAMLLLALGACVMPLYPLAVAQANDRVEARDSVGVMSSLLVVYALGAMLGAAVAGAAMSRFGPPALFWTVAMLLLLLSSAALTHWFRRPAVAPEAKEAFVAVPASSHMLPSMDPRAERQSVPADEAERPAS